MSSSKACRCGTRRHAPPTLGCRLCYPIRLLVLAEVFRRYEDPEQRHECRCGTLKRAPQGLRRCGSVGAGLQSCGRRPRRPRPASTNSVCPSLLPLENRGGRLTIGRRLPTRPTPLPPRRDNPIRQKRADVRQHRHVPELNRGPLPSARFSAHHRQRGHALHGEGEEH